MDVLSESRFATRLAFYDTASGTFKPDGRGRHDGGIHILFADSHIETLSPKVAEIRRMAGPGSDIMGAWAIR
jgi:prepilin-type processing-associated H-X9-DG protein